MYTSPWAQKKGTLMGVVLGEMVQAASLLGSSQEALASKPARRLIVIVMRQGHGKQDTKKGLEKVLFSLLPLSTILLMPV